jgi:hypothetical protein
MPLVHVWTFFAHHGVAGPINIRHGFKGSIQAVHCSSLQRRQGVGQHVHESIHLNKTKTL